MKKDKNERMTCLTMLPEGCIAEILALTTPLDVFSLSLVSKSVQSAADSDSVWENFLPSDYQSIIAESLSPIPDFGSKKDLYVYLCLHPILIDGGRKSFSLEKRTGKKCYFLSAKNLNITWIDTPKYWNWISLPDSRFPQVAELKLVWWLEVWGTIRAEILSPLTPYGAYFVYKLQHEFGFNYPHYRPSEVSLGVSGEFEYGFAFLTQDVEPQHHELVYTLPSIGESDPESEPEYWLDDIFCLKQSFIQRPKLRDDGWFEVELGQFFCANVDDCIEMRMQEVKSGFRKGGLLVEGIEIRPTERV